LYKTRQNKQKINAALGSERENIGKKSDGNRGIDYTFTCTVYPTSHSCLIELDLISLPVEEKLILINIPNGFSSGSQAKGENGYYLVGKKEGIEMFLFLGEIANFKALFFPLHHKRV
jgi:hypothetical protein